MSYDECDAHGTDAQWTEKTWNPVIGCSRVSPGCEHCYAERMAARIVGMHGETSPYAGAVRFDSRGCEEPRPLPRWNGEVAFLPERLDQPLRWRKPRMVFVNSMSDLFHERLANEQIAAVFGVMAATPRHTFQVLTKRAERMREWFRWIADRRDHPLTVCLGAAGQRVTGSRVPTLETEEWPLPNVWLGVSAEDQRRADERIPLLLQCPAAVRWVSAEPLLGPITLRDGGYGCHVERLPWLDWIVIGGESGPGARVCNVAWVRSLVQQCKAAGVPAFVKQLGAHIVQTNFNCTAMDEDQRLTSKHPKGGDPSEWPEDLRVREWPERVR